MIDSFRKVLIFKFKISLLGSGRGFSTYIETRNLLVLTAYSYLQRHQYKIPVCIQQATSGAPATFRPLDFPTEVKVMKLQSTDVDIFQNNLCNKLQNDKKSSAEPRLMLKLVAGN